MSATGNVFAIACTAVNPPRAAAALPVATVSASSLPGSRKCVCRSTNPGRIISPVKSITSALSSFREFPGATFDILSFSIKISTFFSPLRKPFFSKILISCFHLFHYLTHRVINTKLPFSRLLHLQLVQSQLSWCCLQLQQ